MPQVKVLHSAPLPRFVWRRDWKWFLALAVLVYLVCLAVRLLGYSAWEHPGLRVDGGPILATHDSYFWLAGAE
ncbi:MAG: hypothetical protein AB7D57_14385, partial [Desulfovibrionaceae bacterium]